jgi:MbtH protein
MTNPFEDAHGQYVVLVNDEIQYSLWPSFRPAPAGWTVALSERSREECLTWIEANWTDLRPKSLVDAMNADRDARG